MQHAAKCWVRVAAYQAATCMPDPVLNLCSTSSQEESAFEGTRP